LPLHRGGPQVKVAFGADQLWFAAPGGIGRYVRELAPALMNADPALDLSLMRCRFPAGTGPDPAWLARFPAAEVPGPIRTLWPQWALLGRPRLPPAFDPYEVVHATNPAGIPPVRRGQRLVVTVHDLAFVRFPELFPPRWRRQYRAGLRAAVKRADALLVPSQATGEDAVTLAGAPADRIHLTPLAASVPDERDPGAMTRALAGLGVSPPYVLYVGTLEPRKHVVELVRAYRRVAPTVPHALVLAGADGWGIEDLETAIAAGGPGSIVRTGPVDETCLEALYGGADAFVYPSAYEGFGLPVVEAMARGVPVITTSAPALVEVAGDAALRTEPGDEEGLAAALERLLGDPELAERLRERGRARADRYSWSATADATLEVYRAVTDATDHDGAA
jgi:glycosyltransferase involved in cell wall biosynthesis